MSSPRSSASRPVWIALGLILLGFVLCLPLIDGELTKLLTGDGFRQMLDKETSKGMKFHADYGTIQRVGILGLHADSFKGDKGYKTIVSLDATDISCWFNPLGIALRHWEVDGLQIKKGVVWLQKTNPTPGEPKGTPPIPWTAIFWPYRVEMEDIKVDDANVLFKLQNKESGLYHIFLEITPNSRDFEYDGKGGIFKTPLSPALNLQHVHLLIRKPRLYCPTFILGDDPAHPEEQMSITGVAGLQDDRSIKVSAQIKSLAVSPWLPEKLRDHVQGRMSGHLDYHSTGSGLESAQANGTLTIQDAVLHQLAIVQQYVKSTGSPDPGDLHLQTCQSDISLDKGAIMARNLKMECKGVFRLEGNITVAKDKSLSGELQVGLTEPYLKWLPTADTAIFTRNDDGYHTTTVHLSGTMKKPHQDLSERVLKEIGKSPFVAVRLFFNTL